MKDNKVKIQKMVWWNAIRNKKLDKLEKDKDILRLVNDRFDYLKTTCRDLNDRQLENRTMYADTSVCSLAKKHNLIQLYGDYGFQYQSEGVFNITESCVDSAQNKIAKIKPMIILDKRKYSESSRITLEFAESQVKHIFNKRNIWKQGKEAFRGSAVEDLAYVKIMPIDNGKDFIFSCPIPNRVVVENPYSGTHERDEIGEMTWMTREQIQKMFPGVTVDEKTDEHDAVEVFELFKAFEYHIIFSRDQVFMCEKWNLQIPYFRHVWKENSEGFAGKGIVSILSVKQDILTRHVQDIANSFSEVGRPAWLVPEGSNVSRADLANVISRIITYTGNNKPELATWPVITQQYFEWIPKIIDSCYNEVGISEIYSSGELPPGLREGSGAALSTYDEIRQDRFQVVTQAYEDLYRSVAAFILDYQSKTCYKDKYKDLELNDVSSWTTSIISSHPAGQRQDAEYLLSIGAIDKDKFLESIDYHNLDEIISGEGLTRKAIVKKITDALKAGEEIEIDVLLTIEHQLNIGSKMYKSKIVTDGDPKEIEILASYVTRLRDKIDQEVKNNPVDPNQQEQNQPALVNT